MSNKKLQRLTYVRVHDFMGVAFDIIDSYDACVSIFNKTFIIRKVGKVCECGWWNACDLPVFTKPLSQYFVFFFLKIYDVSNQFAYTLD